MQTHPLGNFVGAIFGQDLGKFGNIAQNLGKILDKFGRNLGKRQSD